MVLFPAFQDKIAKLTIIFVQFRVISPNSDHKFPIELKLDSIKKLLCNEAIVFIVLLLYRLYIVANNLTISYQSLMFQRCVHLTCTCMLTVGHTMTADPTVKTATTACDMVSGDFVFFPFVLLLL